jgi:hypothetical protein
MVMLTKLSLLAAGLGVQVVEGCVELQPLVGLLDLVGGLL